MDCLPCSAMAKRSRPIPVSTCLDGSGSRLPSALRLNSIKTLFQISMTCGWSAFTNALPSPLARSSGLRKSTWISVQGPQGPVSPISQKLSFLEARMMRSVSMYFCQIAMLSWSCGTPSLASPSKTVTYSCSLGMRYTSVSSSQAQPMASALK